MKLTLVATPVDREGYFFPGFTVTVEDDSIDAIKVAWPQYWTCTSRRCLSNGTEMPEKPCTCPAHGLKPGQRMYRRLTDRDALPTEIIDTCRVTPRIDIRPIDPRDFASELAKVTDRTLKEADRMVNRLFSGRFTWFWRLWYGVRGL